jgi:AraC-like DNA-binding protein
MQGNALAIFSDPEDFERARAGDGITALLVTGRGRFEARIAAILLHHIRLSAVAERLSRVAIITLQPGFVRFVFPRRLGSLFSCDGVPVAAGQIALHNSRRTLERIEGPCQWGDIVLPARFLSKYVRVLTGTACDLLHPGVHVWTPKQEALHELTTLHKAAVQVTQAHPGKLAGHEAARGLEQQVLQALIECLCEARLVPEKATLSRRHEILCRFEDALLARIKQAPTVAELCEVAGVPGRTLRECCLQCLGMSPKRFLQLRRMQLAHRALRGADPSATSVTAIARHYGFTELGRFAASYRAVFGQLPSTTLHHMGEG